MDNNKPLKPTISFFRNSSILPNETQKYHEYYSLIISRTTEIENSQGIKTTFLKKYFTLEEELTLDLNKIKNNKNHKQILRETLYNQFISFHKSTRLPLIKRINKYYNKFLTTLNTKRDLKKYFQIKFDEKDFNKNEYENTKLNAFLKEMKNGIIDECISFIMSKIPEIEQLPTFLINKKLLKQKVNLIWKINYSIPTQQLRLEKSYAYKYLYDTYSKFMQDTLTLFPKEIFEKDILITLIEILFLSNIHYIQKSIKVKEVFLRKLPNYLSIMHLDNMNEKIRNEFVEKLESAKSVVDEMEGKFSMLKSKLTLNTKVEFDKEGNEKVLDVIFYFTLMLNNIVESVENEGKCNVVTNYKLKCSSIERKFLYNILRNIDKYFLLNNERCFTNSAKYINVIIENMMLRNIFISFCGSLLDSTVRNKVELTQRMLIEKITQSEELQKNIKIKTEFDLFMNEFKKNNKSSLFGKGKEHYVNAILIPSDPEKIANHITIVISKKFDIAVMNQLDSYNKNVDYYYYKWNDLEEKIDTNLLEKMADLVSNISLSISKDMKKTSLEYAGKLLSFVLLSRAVFSYQTISLIGIGEGCEIIIHCIESMYKLNKDMDLITDLMFINGKISVTDNMLILIEGVISGNVYNVYSSLYSKENKEKYKSELVLKYNKIIYNNWKNLDVRDLYFNSKGYRYHLNNIIEKVNFQ